MKKIYRSVFLLLITFSLFQCRKEPTYIGVPDPVPVLPVLIPPNPITATCRAILLMKTICLQPVLLSQLAAKLLSQMPKVILE